MTEVTYIINILMHLTLIPLCLLINYFTNHSLSLFLSIHLSANESITSIAITTVALRYEYTRLFVFFLLSLIFFEKYLGHISGDVNILL